LDVLFEMHNNSSPFWDSFFAATKQVLLYDSQSDKKDSGHTPV